jgi:prefoldin subunit 5
MGGRTADKTGEWLKSNWINVLVVFSAIGSGVIGYTATQSANESANKLQDQRITYLEEAAKDLKAEQKATNQTLNELRSDVRVIREIVERQQKNEKNQ